MSADWARAMKATTAHISTSGATALRGVVGMLRPRVQSLAEGFSKSYHKDSANGIAISLS